jgi:hypothetical protein
VSLVEEGNGRVCREATVSSSHSFSHSWGDASLKNGASNFAAGMGASTPAFFNPERGPGVRVVLLEVVVAVGSPVPSAAAFFAACFSAQVPPIAPPGFRGEDFAGNEEVAFGGTPVKERMGVYQGIEGGAVS